MPYKSNADLPDGVKGALPEHGQTIWRSAFNSALATYDGDESKAAAVAWAAVKRQYTKRGEQWVRNKEALKMPNALREAEWSAARINDLPDSCFAYIESGGTKDNQGKTVPRSKRHFPIKNAAGEYDAAHVRNALARAPQSPFGKEAMPKITAAAKALKIGEPAKESVRIERGLVESITLDGARVDRDKRTVFGVSVLGPKSKNGYAFRESAIREAAGRFDGVKVYLNHQDAMPDVRDLAGRLVATRFESDTTGPRLRGDVLVRKGAAGEMILDDAESNPTLAGFSLHHDSHLSRNAATGLTEITRIEKIHSVDYVAEPATVGGIFESTQKEVTEMEWDNLTSEELHEKRPDLFEAIVAGAQAEVDKTAELKRLQEQNAKLGTELAGLKEAETKRQHAADVETTLNESKLSEEAKKTLRPVLDAAKDKAAMQGLVESVHKAAGTVKSQEHDPNKASDKPASAYVQRLHE